MGEDHAAPLHSARRLGRYELGRRIAVGGMAEIYASRCPDSGRPVVVKALLPQLRDDEEFVRMLAHELELTAELKHPRLVETIGGDPCGPIPYLVLERVDGCTLAQLLRQRAKAAADADPAPLPVSVALSVALALLEALAYIHTRSDADGRPLEVIHRDVTPGNVLLSRSGDIKLGDFGIARSALRLLRTRTGVVKGTLQYMAPEQLAGSDVDRRTDLYGVGSILFEMLTGHPFVEAEREAELLKLVEEPVWRAPSSLRQGLPRALDDALRPALAVFPEERYADADKMATALSRAAERGTVEIARPAAIARLVVDATGQKSEAPAVSPAGPPASVGSDDDAASRRTARREGVEVVAGGSDRRGVSRGKLAALVAVVAAGAAAGALSLRSVGTPERDLAAPSEQAKRAPRGATAAEAAKSESPDAERSAGSIAAVRDGAQRVLAVSRDAPAPRRRRIAPRRSVRRRAMRHRPRRRHSQPGSVPKTDQHSSSAAAAASKPSRTETVSNDEVVSKDRAALAARLSALRRSMARRGILAADLPRAVRGRLDAIGAALRRDQPKTPAATLEKQLASLEHAVSAVQIGEALVRAKMKRVDARLARAPADRRTQALERRVHAALEAVVQRRFGRANELLNKILAALSPK